MKKIIARIFILLCVLTLLPSSVSMQASAYSGGAVSPIPNYVSPAPGSIVTCDQASVFFLSLPAKCLTDEGMKIAEERPPYIIPVEKP